MSGSSFYIACPFLWKPFFWKPLFWKPLLLSLALILASPQAAAIKILSFAILQEAPHDSELFTQGLLLEGDMLVESAGGYSESQIRRYHATTGAITEETELPAHVFAEGIAQVDERLYLLTWQEGTAFVLDADTLAIRDSIKYQGEGWGLAYDGKRLIMSDGSDKLTLRDPHDFSQIATLPVTGGGQIWRKLNELEYAKGFIWANIWLDTRILAIDPEYGTVAGILDLAELVKLNNTRPGHSVLNGIAYDPKRKAFWVTGKLWPRRYLIEIIWPETSSASSQQPSSGNSAN